MEERHGRRRRNHTSKGMILCRVLLISAEDEWLVGIQIVLGKLLHQSINNNGRLEMYP